MGTSNAWMSRETVFALLTANLRRRGRGRVAIAVASVACVACGARTELGAPHASDDCGVTFVSGVDWQTDFGPAQHVCLNPTHPAGCPSDALLYGGALGWSADLSAIAGATWIWRPGISLDDTSDDAQVRFSRTFVLKGKPSGTLSVSVDDLASVFVNGALVGDVGSEVDKSVAAAAQSALTTLDLGPSLVAGANELAIVTKNGPAWFVGCAGSCTYRQNAAGVVFGGHLECH